MRGTCLKNQRGQAATAALIILPIALTLFCGIIVLILALKLEADATAACRVSLVDSQQQAAEALSQLLALNDTAESLERRLQFARLALKAAIFSGNLPGIASARAAIAATELMQVPVVLKQKAALLKGKRSSWMAAARASEAIRASLPKHGSEHDSMRRISAQMEAAFSNTSKTARFEVVASPPGARTPTYRTAPRFEKSQEAQVRWLLKLPNSASPGAIEIGCAVTLEKTKGEKWEPQLTEDRLLPN